MVSRRKAQGADTPENDAALTSVLDAFGVARMVVAHTPVLPVVFPRYDNKVFMVDVGLAGHYGHGFSALKIEGEQLSAMVGGQWFELPSAMNTLTLADYLEEVRDVSANPGRIERYLSALEASEPESAQAAPQAQPTN